MAGPDEKMEQLFEAVNFNVNSDDGSLLLEENFTLSKGLSLHVENVLDLKDFTLIPPETVDVVSFVGCPWRLEELPLKRFVDAYANVPVRIWVLPESGETSLDLISSQRFLVVKNENQYKKTCKAILKQFAQFFGKLMTKLDLNETMTVEIEDLAVFAEEFHIELTPQDLESFLTTFQDEGETFLTQSGVLKWVKKGKPASPVGAIILQLIEARGLLKGFCTEIKRLFFPETDLKDQFAEAAIDLSFGDSEFTDPGFKVDCSLLSRLRLVEQHPADFLNLSNAEGTCVVGLTISRLPGHSDSQVEDFMRDIVVKLGVLAAEGGMEDKCKSVNFEYKIEDDSATLYAIFDIELLSTQNGRCDKEQIIFLSLVKTLLPYELHLTYEMKSGAQTFLDQQEGSLQHILLEGLRAKFRANISSALRDASHRLLLTKMQDLPQLVVSLLHGLKVRMHFSDFDELPEDIQVGIKKAVPQELSTFAVLVQLLGSALCTQKRESSIESQIDLMLRSALELFNFENPRLIATLMNAVLITSLHAPNLSKLLRMDLSELRRKAEERKRAKEAGSDEEEPLQEQTSETKAKPARKTSSVRSRSDSGSEHSRNEIRKDSLVRSRSDSQDSQVKGQRHPLIRSRSNSGSEDSVKARKIATPPQRKGSIKLVVGEEVSQRKASLSSSSSSDSGKRE